MHSRYIKTEYGIEVLENNKQKFIDSLEIGEEFITDYIKGSKAKTYLQVRYLFGGVYKAFTPTAYDNVLDAHKELAELFLKHTDVIDLDDLDRTIEIFSKCRTSKPIISEEKVYVWRSGVPAIKKKITWIQSVASLTRKELNNYIEQIIRKATEYDINILDAKEYLKQLNN